MQQMIVGFLEGLTTLALAVGIPAGIAYIAWGALSSLASGGARVISELVGRLFTVVVVLALVLGAKTVIVPQLTSWLGLG
jgi:hypothetical protein